MNEEEDIYKPLPWQIPTWSDTRLIMLLTGGAGGGKSKVAAEKMHALAMRYKGATLIIGRKARETMKNSTIPFFMNTVGKTTGVRHIASENRVEYPNGSQVIFFGMNDAKQREALRSVGSKGAVDFAWLEEANAFTRQDFNELLGRMRGTAAGWTQVILSTNPDRPSHWINQDIIIPALTDEGRKKLGVYYSKAADNTHNPDSYKETLSMLTGVQYDRLVLGKWVQAEGVVYDEYDPDTHIVEPFEIPADWRRIRGVDFGFTNPFSCLWAAMDPDGRLYFYREIYKTKTLCEDHARNIVKLTGAERIEDTTADHDAEDRATLERHGVPTRQAYKAIQAGIQAVKARLRKAGDGKPRMFFFRNMLVESDPLLIEAKQPLGLLQELEAYALHKGADGKPNKEEPVDAFNHSCLVAGTMVATDYGEKKIEDLQPGMLVRTRAGIFPVIACGMTNPSAEVYELSLSDGRTMTGTANHPVFSGGRYSPLRALRYMDTVSVLQETDEWQNQSKSSTAGESTGGIQTQKIGHPGSITEPQTDPRTSYGPCCINRFGLTPTEGLFRRAIISIMQTATHLITHSKIWSASQRQTTIVITPKTLAPGDCKRRASISHQFVRLLLRGTSQTWADNGTLPSLKICGQTRCLISTSASIAIATLRRLTSDSQNFALITANQQPAGHPASITSREHARAEKCSLSTDTPEQRIVLGHAQIIGVRKLRIRQPVYNLTVGAEVGEYFANGILVHNCDAARYIVAYVDSIDRLGNPRDVMAAATDKTRYKNLAKLLGPSF